MAFGHFAAGLQQGFHLLIVQGVLARSCQLTQIPIGHRTGVFHKSKSVNQFQRKRPAGNRKVLNRALRLRSVVGGCRNLHITHGIAFNAIVAHSGSP